MKSGVVVVLAALVGISSGAGIAIWRDKALPWDGTPQGAKGRLTPVEAAKLTPQDQPSDGIPEVVVDHETHEFGVLNAGSTGTHDFIFTNKGTGTLRLTKGHTTCKCTMANLSTAEVPKGESTKVRLEFKGKGFAGPYKQTATVITNDPKRPRVELTVNGRIVPILRAVPEEIVFSSATAGQTSTATFDLFGYNPTPVKITSHECLEKNTASSFDVKIDPMKPEEVAKEQGAKSGVRVLVSLKPGLPLGTFKQTIRLHTNLADAEHHDVEVRGNVVSDLVIVGADWDEENSLLSIGTVTGKEETSRRLILIARGPDRDKVQLKVAEKSPDLLKVDFDPPKEVSKDLRQLPIVVRIPKGTPPADHLGSETAKVGRIVLETNHPQAPKVLIRVRFAVQN